jgi:hypothetical protein
VAETRQVLEPEDIDVVSMAILKTVSGLYKTRLIVPPPLPPRPWPRPIPEVPPLPIPVPPRIEEAEVDLEEALGNPPWPLPLPRLRAELRLDVDRFYPQMAASGVIRQGLSGQTHWIARLTASGPDRWRGAIWFRDGSLASFPYTSVDIAVSRVSASARLIFSVGGRAPTLTLVLAYHSPYFHPVDFEFDCAEGEQATTSVDTCAHPNRPTMLPCEQLTIPTVFRRAGFAVTTSAGGPVPIAGAGVDAKWTDQEMHDAMQVYWSRFSSQSQWAMWVFFASLHETGTSLGGVMFDDIGPNHRQGTAIFTDSFVSQAPAGDANPQAWVRRMLFWTACHEMGHAFNLAHSWQKSLTYQGKGPWIPLADEPEARSFMNYPFRVNGGQTAFFANFQYRFSDAELLFLRHAPERFVQQGNADWFDHHGFEQAEVEAEPKLKLTVRVNRERPLFEFLEPVVVELKLTNTSTEPELVEEKLLSRSEAMTVIVKKGKEPAREFIPYANYCWNPSRIVLMPGQSMYESLSVSAGQSGWNLAEPGNYIIQVALRFEDEDIVSEPLALRITPPQGVVEEELAQDFFTDEVGRIIALDGSRHLDQGNAVLHEVVAKLPARKVSIHAAVALGSAFARPYKLLQHGGADPRQPFSVQKLRPQAEGKELLEKTLLRRAPASVETLGHIDYKDYVDRFSDLLASEGDSKDAAKAQQILQQTLAARDLHGRKVLGEVLEAIGHRKERYEAGERRKAQGAPERILSTAVQGNDQGNGNRRGGRGRAARVMARAKGGRGKRKVAAR